MALVCPFFPVLLFARRKWAKITIQCYLGFGALVWISTAVRLVHSRLAAEKDWMRMALILTAVAAVNLLAAGLLEGERMRGWFRLNKKTS